MGLNSLAIASLVFLILYFLIFVPLVFGYATKRLKLRSRWTLILFHVTLRLVAQSVGLGFGVIGYKATGLLVAYLILGAEGYFTLVLCTMRFLVSWQARYFNSKDSWLEPRKNKESGLIHMLSALSLFHARKRPTGVMHFLLILANALIISGGSLLSNNSTDASSAWYNNPDLQTAKALRATGQAIFLAITAALSGCVVATVLQARKEDNSRPWFAHRTLLILLFISPLLLCRGVFGICQAVVNSLNYYYPDIYTSHGLAPEFVWKETVFSTLMEWSSCALLCTIYLTSRHDPPKTQPAVSTPYTDSSESKNGYVYGSSTPHTQV